MHVIFFKKLSKPFFHFLTIKIWKYSKSEKKYSKSENISTKKNVYKSFPVEIYHLNII